MAETGNPNGADTLLWVEGIAIPSETGENRTYTTIAVEQDQSARTNRAVGYYENVLGEPLLFVWPKGDLSGQLWIYRRDESAYRECRICLMAQTESRNMAAVIVVELLAADGQSDARDRSLGDAPGSSKG
jgi:hypothetical protein